MNIQIYTCPYLNKSLQVFKIFELLNLSSFDDVQIMKFYFKFQKNDALQKCEAYTLIGCSIEFWKEKNWN